MRTEELEELWTVVLDSRNGVLGTTGVDATPHLSTVNYVADRPAELIRISTTQGRAKFRNLRRNERAALHVARDYRNFAVVEGAVTLAIPREAHDAAVDELLKVHSALGAVIDRKGFGEKMLSSEGWSFEFTSTGSTGRFWTRKGRSVGSRVRPCRETRRAGALLVTSYAF